MNRDREKLRVFARAPERRARLFAPLITADDERATIRAWIASSADSFPAQRGHLAGYV